MTLLLLSLLLGGAPVASGTSPAAAVCPVEAPIHRSTVNRFLTSPALATARNDAGIYVADPADLRLLTDATDSVACQRLNQVSVSGGVLGTSSTPWVYYQLGNRYVVVSAEPSVDQPGMLSTRMRFLAVLDMDFKFVKGYGL